MPSSKELMDNAPKVAAQGELTYLGVPKGFAAPQADETFRPPKYEEGAQYKPNGLSPEIRAQLQVKMDAAGLYDKGDRIRVGVWDETTVAAYTKLLKFANQGGRSVTEALNELGTLSPSERAEAGLAGVGKGGAGGTASNPLVVTLSNPNDLRTLADRTARKTLGRAISEAEMQKFVTAYQSLERQEQAAKHSAQEGAGGTVVAAPDPGAFAEQQVEALDPVAAEAARQVSIFKTISGALSGMKG